MSDSFECEGCGTRGETPAATVTVPGYRGTVELPLCEGCANDKERRR